MLIKALRAHKFGVGENRIVKRVGCGRCPARILKDVASGVQVTKVDCSRFPGPI